MTDIETTRNNKNLWAALMLAQQSLNAVQKDAKNDWGKYGYTSAEQMISECRKALLGSGLVFARTNWSLIEDKVSSYFILVHPESGETLEFGNEMLVVASKNPDKSILAALTTVMNYALRDLLLIPRVDERQPEIDNRPQDAILSPKRAVAPPKAEMDEKAPDWLVKAFEWIKAQKEDADEYVRRLLAAAGQKYDSEFASVSDLPKDYLTKVFEHHGYTVSLVDSTVEKDDK